MSVRVIMKYILFISFLFFIPVAQAGVHVEPYISGGVSYAPLGGAVGAGGRVGYSVPLISAGLDLFWNYHGIGTSSSIWPLEVHHSTQPIKGFSQSSESPTFYYSSESVDSFAPFSIGVFGAINLPLIVNTYGTLFYSMGEKGNADYKGYGVKLGISYLAALFLQVNTELQWARYNCDNRNASCKEGFNIFSLFVSLSMPLDRFFGAGRDLDGREDDESSNSLIESESSDSSADNEVMM